MSECKCKHPHIVAKVYDEAAEEPKYHITPKGCAMLAFMDAGIEMNEESFNCFWEEFEKTLNKSGYLIVE